MNKEEYYNQSIDESVADQKSLKSKRDDKKNLHRTVVEFEKSIIDLKNKKIKFLGIGLGISTVICILLALSIAFLAPLKTSIPYLLRVDNTTGFVDKVEPYNASKTNVNEAVQRYFIAKYVVNRESYEWYTIQNMYDFVKETSNKATFTSYDNYFKSEYSPLEKLGKSMKMVTTINSITFLDDSTVQVRFTRSFAENSGARVPNLPDSKWMATISFAFDKDVKTEKQRLINPLGFVVNSYKLDAEIN